MGGRSEIKVIDKGLKMNHVLLKTIKYFWNCGYFSKCKNLKMQNIYILSVTWDVFGINGDMHYQCTIYHSKTTKCIYILRNTVLKYEHTVT